jgi:transposase
MSQNPVRTHRKFDATFKREAVANWLSSGKSAEIIAQELGLHVNLLYKWRQQYAPAAPAPVTAKPGSPEDLQAQLAAAHREIRHLREQRDILKKTLGILSEPAPSATNGLTR